MANVTPKTDLRMLIVPLEEAQVGHALPTGSTVTLTATEEAGAHPGGFTPVRSTPTTPVSSGTLDSGVPAVPNVTVSTVLAGSVGSATWGWTPSGGSALYWDPPFSISGFENVDYSAAALKWSSGIHAVRRPDSGLLLACGADNNGTDLIWMQQDFRGKWSTGTILADYAPKSCLVVVPNGSLWRYVCLYMKGTSASGGVQMSYSDDSGATWSVGSTRGMRTDIYTLSEVVRIRAAYLGGKIALFVYYRPTAGTDSIDQWVSTDAGGTFSLVETFSSSLRAYPDCAVYNGRIHVAYLKYESGRTGADIFPGVRVLADASQPLSTSGAGLGDVVPANASHPMEWGTQAASTFTAGELALAVDDDGVVYVYGIDFAGTKEGICRFYKSDAWQDPYISGHSSPVGVCWWSGQDTATYPRHLVVVPERGRMALLHTGSPTATDDTSVWVAFLGGWTDIGMPQDGDYDDGLGVAGYERVWVGYDEPENIGATWTRTLTGAATATRSANGLSLASSIGESAYYTATPAMTGSYDANGCLVEVHVDVNTGTYSVSNRITDGTNDFHFQVSVTTTQIILYDMNAGPAVLATVTTTDGTDAVAIRLHAYATGAYSGNNGAVKAWYRKDGPWAGGAVNFGPRQYRDWTVIGAATGATFGVATTARVRAGHSNTNSTSVTRFMAFTDGQFAASTTPGASGRVLTGPAAPLHLTGGLRMHATSGPTVYGDTWTHTAAHDYPAEHVDPVLYPSPRTRHRSTTVAQPIDLTWTTDTGTVGTLAIYIAGANWRTATLYADTGAATPICTIDLGVTGLAYTRSRGLIQPASGGAALGFYAHEGALTGATVDLGGSGLRKIRGNRPGAWIASGAPATYGSVRAELATYDGADATSGTLILRMPGGLFLVEGVASTGTFMLRIDAQATADGYIETGTVLLGRPYVLREYAAGRAKGITPNTSLTTLESGGRMAHRRGPARRSVELTWSDPVDTFDTSGTVTTAPDHYTLGYSGAPAIATPGDTTTTIGGILAHRTDGSRVPVVYVEAFKQPSAALTSSVPWREISPHVVLYGRVTTESWRTDAPAGYENSTEAVKGGLLTIEEEV